MVGGVLLGDIDEPRASFDEQDADDAFIYWADDPIVSSELKKYGTVTVDKDMCIICVVGDLTADNVGFTSLTADALKDIPVSRSADLYLQLREAPFLARSVLNLRE